MMKTNEELMRGLTERRLIDRDTSTTQPQAPGYFDRNGQMTPQTEYGVFMTATEVWLGANMKWFENRAFALPFPSVTAATAYAIEQGYELHQFSVGALEP